MSRRVVIVGLGQMGRWFERFFVEHGCSVRGLDAGDWTEAPDHLSVCDLALVCVPIAVTEEVIGAIGPHLPRAAVLADITSTKRAPVAAMLGAHAGPVLGLHPMFGPDAASLRGQTIVSIPAREPGASAWVLDLFRHAGAAITEATADEHDRAMIQVQALRHFATLALGAFLAERDGASERSLRFSSPIYRIELSIIQRLLAQDAALYADIMLASEERRETIAAYAERVAELAGVVTRGDRAALIGAFEQAAERSEMDRDRVGTETKLLIDTLAEHIAGNTLGP
ncbi:MAG: prephenate dehydrogenase/arogenate dehydrogenase family protein [Planctomycetota bacterium]